MKETKANFKDIQKTIHLILKTSNTMLKAYVKELNEFFNNTAKRVANEIT